MKTSISRRFFLGGSAAAAGLLASGAVVPFSQASAGAAPSAGKMPYFGPRPGIARLASNENPYGPSQAALAAMAEASAQGGYYARESVTWLRDMIAERNGVPAEWISISPGSTGVLTWLAVAASKTGKILQPTLTWDSNIRNAINQGAEVVKVPLAADMGIVLADMYAAIDDSISMVMITNPNNPTGLTLPTDALTDFCRRASQKTLVLVDEAYIDLADDPEKMSMIGLVKEGLNVAVSRTFSKVYGLAGLRIGYVIAPPAVTEAIANHGLGDNPMTQPGVAAAIATYDDFKFLEMSKAKIVEGREMVLAGVKQVGLTALPSATNFVYVNLGNLLADEFRDRMAARNILVRGMYPGFDHWSRVSMGRVEEVQRYVDALPGVLDELKA